MLTDLCAGAESTWPAEWVWSIGVAKENARFVALVGRVKRFEAAKASFSSISTDPLGLQHDQMPKSRDPAIFVRTKPITLSLTCPLFGGSTVLLLC